MSHREDLLQLPYIAASTPWNASELIRNHYPSLRPIQPNSGFPVLAPACRAVVPCSHRTTYSYRPSSSLLLFLRLVSIKALKCLYGQAQLHHEPEQPGGSEGQLLDAREIPEGCAPVSPAAATLIAVTIIICFVSSFI